MSTLANLVRNTFRPGYGKVILHKAMLRVSRRDTVRERNTVAQWCRDQETSIAAWATAIDADLWAEATTFAQDQQAIARPKLDALGIDLGGGGAYDFLYFVTRRLKPDTIVETGVAAGFSSRAFLSALRINGSGRLFSSDFPYFRLANPERYVGFLVEPDLRGDWSPLISGDEYNIPKIRAHVSKIDIFHYDSDKSYEGRAFAYDVLRDTFHEQTLILYDDIQDNTHFMDFVQKRVGPYQVFKFEGKWVGMTGGPNDFYAA